MITIIQPQPNNKPPPPFPNGLAINALRTSLWFYQTSKLWKNNHTGDNSICTCVGFFARATVVMD